MRRWQVHTSRWSGKCEIGYELSAPRGRNLERAKSLAIARGLRKKHEMMPCFVLKEGKQKNLRCLLQTSDILSELHSQASQVLEQSYFFHEGCN